MKRDWLNVEYHILYIQTRLYLTISPVSLLTCSTHWAVDATVFVFKSYSILLHCFLPKLLSVNLGILLLNLSCG